MIMRERESERERERERESAREEETERERERERDSKVYQEKTRTYCVGHKPQHPHQTEDTDHKGDSILSSCRKMTALN